MLLSWCGDKKVFKLSLMHILFIASFKISRAHVARRLKCWTIRQWVVPVVRAYWKPCYGLSWTPATLNISFFPFVSLRYHWVHLCSNGWRMSPWVFTYSWETRSTQWSLQTLYTPVDCSTLKCNAFTIMRQRQPTIHWTILKGAK